MQSRLSSSGPGALQIGGLSLRGVIQSALLPSCLFLRILSSGTTHTIPGVQVFFGKGTVEYVQGLRGMSWASWECQPLCCLEEPFFTLTEEGEEV